MLEYLYETCNTHSMFLFYAQTHAFHITSLEVPHHDQNKYNPDI